MKTDHEKFIATFNEGRLNYPSAIGDPLSGTLYGLANDSTFAGANLNVGLTEFVAGLSENQKLEDTLNRIVPKVPAPKKFNWRSYTEMGQFIDMATDDKDSRPRGADFNAVKFDGADTDGRLYNRGLQIVIDDDDGGEDPAVQQLYASWLQNICWRAEIIRALAKLSGAATSQGSITWTTGTSCTPNSDLARLANLSGDGRGTDANKMVIGFASWLDRMTACERAVNPGVAAGARDTPEMVASLLGMDDIVRVNIRKQTTLVAKAQVLTGVVYAYQASAIAVKEDPSNIKRFVGTEGPQVYTERLTKRTKIAFSHYSNTVITNTLGIVSYTIA